MGRKRRRGRAAKGRRVRRRKKRRRGRAAKRERRMDTCRD
jgi:hypothetical protein